MTILFLHSSSDLYGASRVLTDIVKVAAGERHRCLVILSEDGPLSTELRTFGAEVRIIRLGILRRKYFTPKGLINRIFFLVRAICKTSRLIRKEKVNLVYSNTTAVLAGAFAAKITGRKHVWHVHETLESPRMLVRFLGFMLRYFSHKAIMVSEATHKNWEKIRKFRKGQLCVIHNGINPKPYLNNRNGILRKDLGIGPEILLIGMVGRVHNGKGQDYFLKMARLIADRIKNVRFVMIGDAFPGYEYLYKKIDSQIHDLSLDDSVTRLGFRNDIPEILGDLDIFILPSTLPDSLPTTILEAMASAVPVVTTTNGGAKELVIHNANGFHIPIYDEAEAVTVMAPLLTDAGLRSTMGNNGRQRVIENFSPEAFRDKISLVISEFSQSAN